MGGGNSVSVLCDSVRCVRRGRWEREVGREDRSLLDKSRAKENRNQSPLVSNIIHTPTRTRYS